MMINMCNNTVGKWVGVGYESDFGRHILYNDITEHPGWMVRLVKLNIRFISWMRNFDLDELSSECGDSFFHFSVT